MDFDKPRADEYNLQKVGFLLFVFAWVALQAHAVVFLGT